MTHIDINETCNRFFVKHDWLGMEIRLLHFYPKSIRCIFNNKMICKLSSFKARNFYTGAYGNGLSYVWASGKSLTYTNWMPGEPVGLVDCVVLSWQYARDSVWDDLPCFLQERYICEKYVFPIVHRKVPECMYV